MTFKAPGGFVLRWIGILLMGLGGHLSSAHTRYVLDFDGTFVQDQGPNAAWRTDWILVRTDKRHSHLQPNPSAPINLFIPSENGTVREVAVQHPELLHISFSDYRKISRFLASDDGLLGNLDTRHPFHLTPDPLRLHPDQPEWILPGIYRVEPAITFDRFQTIGRRFEVHPLDHDARNAFRRMEISSQRYQIEGPAFRLAQGALSDPRKPNRLSFFTARGLEHSDLLNYVLGPFYQRGLLPNDPSTMGVTLLSLGDPKNLSLLGKGSTEKLKVSAVHIEALQMLQTPRNAHFELSPDPRAAARGEYVKMNTLVVAEDDLVHIQNVGTYMAELSMRPEFKKNVKLVLLQSVVDDSDLNRRWPQRWTVFYDGRGRPATQGEIDIWERGEEPESPCQGQLETESAS